MLRALKPPTAPPPLQGPALFDSSGLPRFWASVWSVLQPGDLSLATVTKKLGHIESLYLHADTILGDGGFDHALATTDVESLITVLESRFVALRNHPVTTSADERWQVSMSFVTDVTRRIASSSPSKIRARELQGSLTQLEHRFSPLYIGHRKRPERIRSLPAEVIETLYERLDPMSPSNPFPNGNSRWRVYLIFMLLLHQGLRRGELLALPLDGVKHSFFSKEQRDRCWLTVRYNAYEDDPRSSRPSIKNASSVRQIPVGEPIARLVDEYVGNYRGRPAHSFLLNSQKNRPLSTEGITKMFEKINNSLPQRVLNLLEDHTGSSHISAHHLRHTCAVFRLNQMLADGVAMEDALQRLRVFFGWSRSSDMPLRYARTVFEDRLASVWKAEFDDRVNVLRCLGSASK